MIKLGQMELKRVKCVYKAKIRSNGLEKSQLGIQCQKSGHIVLKGVNWACNDKIRCNGLESSQVGTH